MADIVLTGLAANDPVPGNYQEILFAQGEQSLGNGTWSALLMGNKTSDGSATVDTVVYGPNSATPLQTEADAISLFGIGSELHLMWKDFVAINPETPVYAIAVTASGGTAASRDHVIANAATANGNLRIWVGDEFVDTPIASGDSVATIVAAAVVAVNTKTHWQVTASDVTNTTIRLTAKHAGPRGNWLRSMCSITNGITTTVSNSSSGFLASGATADSNTTAIATIASGNYHYIVSAAEDATQFGALATQVGSNAAPTVGIRQVCFAGQNSTSSAATTIASGINNARAEFIWLQNSDIPGCRLAARAAAAYSLFELGVKPRCNFSGFGNDINDVNYWRTKAPLSGTIPSRATIKTVLNSGVTPIGVNANGTTYIVKRITTRCTTSSIADYRIRDAHKVTVLDKFADDWNAKCVAQFSGKKIGSDPAQGARVPGEDVVTPLVVRAAAIKLLRDYEELDLLENVDASIASLTVTRNSSPTTRMGVRFKHDVVDILDQVGTVHSQVG